MPLETLNARIARTTLGAEDHGIMTFMLTLEFDLGGQGFGGYALDVWRESHRRRIGTAYGMEAIMSLLRTVGVERWEDLVGRHVRIRRNGHYIRQIGHIIEDKWLDLEALAKEMGPYDVPAHKRDKAGGGR